MKSHALSGAFDAVCTFHHNIHEWWDHKVFTLYYYSLSQDPSPILNKLPLNQHITHHLASGLDAVRHSTLSSVATRIAAGDEAKPSWGDAWTGLNAHLQNGLRPMLEQALRSGMGAPMRLALIGFAALLLCDAVYGGPIHNTITQTINHFNAQSGKSSQKEKPDEAARHIKTDYRPEIFRLYARPSVF